MFPLKDTIPSYRKPYVTLSIIVINIVVFIYELNLPSGELLEFFYRFGIVPARYTSAEFSMLMGLSRFNLFPFISAMFIHGGWSHIISNMWALWLFGDNVEDILGHFGFAVFYVLSGLAASLLHFLFSWNSQVPMLGASGAIAGVMGAYFVLFPHSRIITFIPLFFIPFLVEIPAVIYLGIWFITQFFNGTVSTLMRGNFGGVAWWAHIGGFLFGMNMWKRFLRDNRRRYIHFG